MATQLFLTRCAIATLMKGHYQLSGRTTDMAKITMILADNTPTYQQSSEQDAAYLIHVVPQLVVLQITLIFQKQFVGLAALLGLQPAAVPAEHREVQVAI